MLSNQQLVTSYLLMTLLCKARCLQIQCMCIHVHSCVYMFVFLCVYNMYMRAQHLNCINMTFIYHSTQLNEIKIIICHKMYFSELIMGVELIMNCLTNVAN